MIITLINLANENDPSKASIDVYEGRFYYCIRGDIAAQHRQKTLKRTVERHLIRISVDI